MALSIKEQNFAKIKNRFFFLLIGIFSLLFLYVLQPFFYPLFWAAVIAILVYPYYEHLARLIRSHSAASIIMVLSVLVLIILPVILVGFLVVKESVNLYAAAKDSNFVVQPISEIFSGTFAAPYLLQLKALWQEYATEVTQSVGGFVVGSFKTITQNTINFIGMLFLCLYSLFFFLKDGKKILGRIMELSPLGDKYDRALFNKFSETVTATLHSTLFLGLIQGAIGGILFYATGVPGALVWGVVMVALSIIPAAGSFLVWIPAALIQFAIGNVWQGATILAVGFGIISVVDNVLRPLLVGKEMEMHPIIVLFSTLGGLVIFGISGFVIGPVLAALCLALYSVYEQYYRKNLTSNR
jgi:predicted PurR-regulated permease PerM